MSKISLLIRLSLIAGTILLAATSMPAQTCKVNVGTSPTGSVSYIEVFEYDFVTDKPTFPGGDSQFMKYINNVREYPKEAYDKGVQGRVTCSFVVNQDGSICHVSILKGVEASLNKEALRILSKMPDWVPGKINGQPVPTRVIRSVPFRK